MNSSNWDGNQNNSRNVGQTEYKIKGKIAVW